MTIAIIFIILGLGLLAGGGDVLLKGAVGLAKKLNVTPAVIGLTVVAAGTSVPELAVSVLAGLRGSVDIAVGNVVGSNIANATLILGLAALITPLAVTGNMIRLEYPVMALVTLMCLVVFDDGFVSRLDAILFLCTYIGFTAYVISIVKEHMHQEEHEQVTKEVSKLDNQSTSTKATIALIAGGVALLAVGAELTIRGAVELGKLAGMSERVIGLTIVACGTSLPEIVTSVVAGLRGRADVAIGNVIGSNLFNILFILGIASLISPIPVSLELRSHDTYWMLGTALVLFPIMRSGMRIDRREGLVLLAIFMGYLAFVL